MDYRAEIMDLRSRCYSPRSVVGQRLRLPSRLFRLLPRSDPEVADGLCFALRSSLRAPCSRVPAACTEGVAGVARLRKGSPWRDRRHLKFYELPDNLSQPGRGDTLSVIRRARTGAPRRAARCGLV